jgi:hypothetical protein
VVNTPAQVMRIAHHRLMIGIGRFLMRSGSLVFLLVGTTLR